mmetsp:Transcript_5057/g.12920  ORF Transcript_5057/g.12920 Transcript_5057/m.12920 type:complete len:566 (+) Transcript_5057:91-1788(+)
MSHDSAKVNPFYIQDDEEDLWDDDDDYDDEQVMLISGSGSNNNRGYNAPGNFLKNGLSGTRLRAAPFGRQDGSQSYQDGRHGFDERNRRHRAPLWKYGIVFLTVVMVVLFREDHQASTTGGDVSLIEKKIAEDNDEYRIVVLGERHSGTNWMRKRLRECFPHINVSTNLQRPGNFFQDDEETARSKYEQNLGSGDDKTSPKMDDYRDIIVVHMTLNAYDWLEQMRLSPEYAPDHTGTHKELGHVVPLGWEEFISKPWTMERPPTDLPLANETGPVCKMGFQYHEVVSCSGSENGIGAPMYELQREKKGLPFKSIIDLRTAKLKNHNGVQESWPSVKKMVQVKYETLAQDFKELLEQIQELTERDDAKDGENGISNLPCNVNVLPPSYDSSNEMTLEFVDYVTKFVDWEIEQSIASYVSWTESDIAAKSIRLPKAAKNTNEDNTEKKKKKWKTKKENKNESSLTSGNEIQSAEKSEGTNKDDGKTQSNSTAVDPKEEEVIVNEKEETLNTEQEKEAESSRNDGNASADKKKNATGEKIGGNGEEKRNREKKDNGNSSSNNQEKEGD